MKKIRISMIALAALVMAVAGTAFTFKAAPKKATTSFLYQYQETTTANLMDNTKWQFIASLEDGGCPTEENDVNCVIQLPDGPDGSNNPPDFGTTYNYTDQEDLGPVTQAWKAESR